jgi:hypothetical protein
VLKVSIAQGIVIANLCEGSRTAAYGSNCEGCPIVTAKAAEAEGNCEDNGVADDSAARSCRISRCSPSILSITLFNWDDFFLRDF